MVTTDDVKRLRELTGAGVMDSKRALEEASGDFEAARELLREQGIAAAAGRAERETGQGLVEAYIHGEGRIGALVEVNCETDFVAKTDDFTGFVHNIGMQIAAMGPQWVNIEDVPKATVEKEREIRMAAAKEEGKPEKVIPKIVDGQIRKWYTEVCLLEQEYVKEKKKPIKNLLTELVAKIGENCKIRRFVRWEVGEGIEVSKKDFAEEIKEMTQG